MKSKSSSPRGPSPRRPSVDATAIEAAALAVGTDPSAQWAERAFRAVDHHPAYSRVRAWFNAAWPRLIVDTWRPVYYQIDKALATTEAASQTLPRRQPDFGASLPDLRLAYLSRLLEHALWWGIAAEIHPERFEQVHAAAAHLAEVDASLRQAAQHLESLLIERQQIFEAGVVWSEWLAFGHAHVRTSIDLAELIECAAKGPEFADWAAVSREALRGFLVATRTQCGRAQPGLADVVHQLAGATFSSPEARHSDDAALLAKRKGQGLRPGAELAALRLSFMAGLLGSLGCGARDWPGVRAAVLTPLPGSGASEGQPLSTLLKVASGRYGRTNARDPLSAAALRKLAFEFDPDDPRPFVLGHDIGAKWLRGRD